MIDINNFDSIMKFISTGIGIRVVYTNGLIICRDYIEKKFNDYGIKTRRHNFLNEGKELTNVIGEIACKTKTDKTIILMAHYDSVKNCRGCIDNASGVSTVLELARVFALQGGHQTYNLRFIALSAEEIGTVGSKAYLKDLSAEEKSNIVCAFNFDMFMSKKEDPSALVANSMGGMRDGKYYSDESDEGGSNIITDAILQASKGVDIPLWCPRNYGHSDHQSFHEHQIPSANVTIRGTKERNAKLPEGYHTSADVYDKNIFNYELCEKALNVVYNSINLIK